MAVPAAPAVPRDDPPPEEGAFLAKGSWGKVYEVKGEPKKVMKYITTMRQNAYETNQAYKDLVSEVTIQQQLHAKVPDACPELYDFVKVKSNEYIVVMEKCEGTAYSWLLNNGRNDTEFLDFLEQVAVVLKRAQRAIGLNHRDLHAGNIMYKTVDRANLKTREVKKIKKFLLVDFGFSCASINGTRYEGTQYFEAGQKCFRASRDLALLIYRTNTEVALSAKMKQFIKTLLTFTYKNEDGDDVDCDMTDVCEGFDRTEFEEYEFLNKDGVENPKTTPDGLIAEIKKYRATASAAPAVPVVPVAPKNLYVSPPSPPTPVPPPAPPTPPEAEAKPVGSTGATPKWSGGKKRAYSGGYTRRRAHGARARRKTLRHKRSIRRLQRG